MFQKILIAYDDSPESRRALATGMQLASELGANVTVVSVLEPLPGYVNMAGAVAPEVPAGLREERRIRMEHLHENVKSEAAAKSVSVETLLVEGHEIEGILSALRETHAQLLVIGVRRHSTGIEWAGTVRRIANEISCPILGVP